MEEPQSDRTRGGHLGNQPHADRVGEKKAVGETMVQK